MSKSPSVQKLLESISYCKLCSRRRSNATKRLKHQKIYICEWVKDIVDLQDFKHCYFVNGVTDAITQWVATETRTWQYLRR